MGVLWSRDGHLLALLARDVGLQPAGEDSVYDTVAVVRVLRRHAVRTCRITMQELVRQFTMVPHHNARISASVHTGHGDNSMSGASAASVQ